MTGHAPDPHAEAYAQAIERNRGRVAGWYRQLYYRSVPVDTVAVQLGITVDDLDAMIAAGDLVMVDGPAGPRLPGWQLTDTGPLPGIRRVTDVFPGGPLRISGWATAPNPMLHDRTPAAALADGDVVAVIAAARAVPS